MINSVYGKTMEKLRERKKMLDCLIMLRIIKNM